MTKGRLEAFSDGVFAIIITIMVLELKAPHVGGFEALRQLALPFVAYVLSFIYVGIYWNNHHHMLHVTRKIDGSVLWANLHLLFWLTLFPFVTDWVGESHFSQSAVVVYGGVLLCAAMAYWILQRRIIRCEGRDGLLASAMGRDLKGNLSLAVYALGIGLSWVSPWISAALYVAVALVWLIPDRRIEKRLNAERKESST